MSENFKQKESLAFGSVTEHNTFEIDPLLKNENDEPVEPVNQLAKFAQNRIISGIAQGENVYKKLNAELENSYKRALELNPDIGSYGDWQNIVLPNTVDPKKELSLFEKLDQGLVETDGVLVQEFKKFTDDPSYVSPELAEAQDKFNNLKRIAIGTSRSEEQDPESSTSLPFVSVKDEEGQDIVLTQNAEQLTTEHDSLEKALRVSLDSGALKPRDLLAVASNLKFAEGTGKTYSDLQREYELTFKVVGFTNEILNQAQQVKERTGDSPRLYHFKGDSDLVKSLNALTLDIRLDHQELTNTTDTVDPEKRYLYEKLPAFARFALLAGTAQWEGIKSKYRDFFPKPDPLNFGVPLTPLEEPLNHALENLSEDDINFSKDKSAIAERFREKFQITNLSDDQVIESVKRALHTQLHSSGLLPYIIDEKSLFLNIKKEENFGITVHPDLFVNRKAFEKAVKQHPDLTKKDIEVVKEKRKLFYASQARELEDLIFSSAPTTKKWLEAKEKNFKLKAEDQKDLATILEEFLSDDENFSYLSDNLRSFGFSAVSSVPMIYHSVVGALGSESSTNKAIEIQLRKDEGKQLSSAFGRGGFFLDVSNVAGDLVIDLGATALSGVPANSAAKKLALEIAGKKLAAQGYKISKIKGTTNALHAAFFSTDTASKKKLAAQLLTAGTITPLKTKKYTEGIVKVLADDFAALSLSNTEKLTDLGALAFSVGAPSGLRSASYAYSSYMQALPDNLSFDEKRKRAVPLAIARGALTAAITVGASYLGRGGAEAVVAKRPSKLMELRGYKATKNALENLAKMSRATDKVGKGLLVSEVAEIAAAIARNGLRRSMLFGLGAKTVLTDLAKVGIDEGIEEGLDEFLGSFVDEYATGNNITLGERLGSTAYAGLLGLTMGVGVSGTAKVIGAASSKLGIGDTTKSTENVYRQLVDMVMEEASTLNEAASNARNAQAPLTAEVLEQNREQLLAGVAKNPVASAAVFRMSVTRDTNISEERESSEIVTVNAEDVTGVSETTNEKGETIFAVEYSPVDASGEVLTAFTKNASVTRLDVRVRENYKIEQEIIQQIEEEVLIPNVEDQNEALRTAEGIEAATNNFIKKHKVALKNNNISILIDPTEEQQQGFIDTVQGNQEYQILQGAESSVKINEEGTVFIIINTANTSEVTNSIPKQRRTTYMQSVFTEALASSFELVSIRDKYFGLEPENRGDLSLEQFINLDRLAVYEEMSQYERDWASSLILGEEVTEGLSEKVSNSSLIAATHINSLLQLDMSGQVKGVQKTAWAGKSRGGALSKNVKQKLFDILSYLRAAIRTARDSSSRAFLRNHVNFISDNLTKPFFDAVSNLSEAQQAQAIDEASQQDGEILNQKVNPIEDSPILGNVPQVSLETVPKEIKGKKESAKPSIFPEGEVGDLNFDDVEQPSESDTVIGRNAEGDLIVFQSMTLAEAEVYLSNLEKLKGNFIEQTTPVKIFISPNSTPNTDSNTQIILQTKVNSQAFSLNSVQGSPDTPSLRQAIIENPLFSKGMVENSLDGSNVVYKIEEDPDNPSSFNLYAFPKVLRFTRELTPSDIDAINTNTAAGVDPKKLSQGTALEIAKKLFDKTIQVPSNPSFSEEASAEIDINTELSSETASEDYIEPVQQTSVDGTGLDTQDPPKAKNKQREKRKKQAKKIYASLQRRLLREGTRFFEGVRESGAAAWYDRSKMAVGINPEVLYDILVDENNLAAAKAILNLAVDEELIHQISWETLSYKERQQAINELLNADRRGANALIRMVQEYNTEIQNYTPEETIQILRLGLPETDSLPAGIEDTPTNRALKDEIADYVFEELIRKHVSLVNGRGATEPDYDFLRGKDKEGKSTKKVGVLDVYKKYIENFFIGRLRAKKALRKDSKLGPYYATAVAKVAQEFKAAKEGFRRRPDYDKLDLDIDLGVYSKQSTLIGTEISTVAPEEEQREEWLSEIDPEQVKASVVKGRTVGTRSPSAKGKLGEGADPNKVVTLKDLRENPEAYKKNALILLNYPVVAREFQDDPLLEKVRKAKAPVNKAELKKQQLRQDIKSAKDRLKSDLVTYKANERSDELKPQRKQEADSLKKKYSDSQNAVKEIEREVNKLNNSLKRANKRLRETISKENKKINALIKRARSAGNETVLKELQQRKVDVKNILSNDGKTAELIEGINSSLIEARQRLATIKKLSKSNKSAFEKALKEFSKPTVNKNSIKLSASQVVTTVEQFVTDIEEGTPVRVGAKALIVKLNAINKKEKELKSAIQDAKTKTTKFGDVLKRLSKSEKAFPINTADEIYASLNDVAQQNLGMLIKLFPQDLRVYASLWYDGANIIANKFAKTFDISVEQAAAVLAVFSPQKDWYMNVSLAERTMHIFKARQAALFDGSMVSNFLRRAGEPELKYDKNGNPFYEGDAVPVYDEDGNHTTDENGVLQFDNWGSEKAKDKFELSKQVLNLGLAGKRFNEIEDISFPHKGKQKKFSKEALQARFIRMFSEAAENEALRDPKTFNVIRPDGAILERPSLSEKGAPRSIAWGSYSTIEKAIKILNADQDNSIDVISNELGLMHKVRSFYNNISDPSSRAGHVTMDTHAVAALLLKPVSGNSIEVTQNFGGQGTASDSNLGISGLYPAFAEAYRSVSFLNDTTKEEYLVREIQSITWEAVRMLFPSKWKSNKNNVRAIEELHAKYEKGIISLEQLQEQIYSFVQTSQAKGMPADEALSVTEGIQSANTVRGLGVGRPDWGQAAPVSVEAPPSEQEQFTSIRWRNLETRHADLASRDISEKQGIFKEEIAELFREASRKAEEKIPDYFSYEEPAGLLMYTDLTEEKYIYKNPKGSALDRDANLKDYKQFILTPANKYMFSPNMTPREAVLALGLKEYLIITDGTSNLEPDKVIIHVSNGTTRPYNQTGAGVEVVKSFYGEEVEVIFEAEKTDLMKAMLDPDQALKAQLERNLKKTNRFLYDRRGKLIPLSVRFAPFSEVKYEPQDVEDPIELFDTTERIIRNPYDRDARRAEYSANFIVPIANDLVTNIESILNTVIDYRNPKGEESAMVPIAKFLLETISDDMLRWRVFHDPKLTQLKDPDNRSYSSPDPDVGIMLDTGSAMVVPKDFPQAKKYTRNTKYITTPTWIKNKFNTPIDAITKWKGTIDGLDALVEGQRYLPSEDSFNYVPPIDDFGDYNNLSRKRKNVLEDYLRYHIDKYEVGETIFDSEGGTDLDEISTYTDINLKDRPDLEKYISWDYFFKFLGDNSFYKTKEGKHWLRPRPDPSGAKVSYKVRGVSPSTIIHEIFHALTQREIDRYVINTRAKGLKLYNAYKKKASDISVPEPLRELLRVYLKAVDYGDEYLELREKKGTIVKPTKSSRHISKMMNSGYKRGADKASERQFYGLANLDEFVTMSMMSPEFQIWLMSIPDLEAAQNGEARSLWDKFTEIVTNIVNHLRKDPDFVRDREVEGGANLFKSAIKSVMEVAALNGNVNRNLANMGYDSVSKWKTIKGANAGKAEAEALRKGRDESFIEEHGLNLPPVTREILSGVYKYNPEEASGTQNPATVATYKNLFPYIEDKAFSKRLTEFMAKYDVVDWGSGMGRGTNKLKEELKISIADGYITQIRKGQVNIESYEPYFVEGKGNFPPSLKRKPRKESQDLIISSQVINVLPADERAELLEDIYASLREEGQAIITTRSVGQVRDGIKEERRKLIGPAEYISSVDGKATTFQKGFDKKSLKKFIEEVLPEAVVTTTGLKISPVYAIITKPIGAGLELDSEPDIQSTKVTSKTQPLKGSLDQAFIIMLNPEGGVLNDVKEMQNQIANYGLGMIPLAEEDLHFTMVGSAFNEQVSINKNIKPDFDITLGPPQYAVEIKPKENALGMEIKRSVFARVIEQDKFKEYTDKVIGRKSPDTDRDYHITLATATGGPRSAVAYPNKNASLFFEQGPRTQFSYSKYEAGPEKMRILDTPASEAAGEAQEKLEKLRENEMFWNTAALRGDRRLNSADQAFPLRAGLTSEMGLSLPERRFLEEVPDFVKNYKQVQKVLQKTVNETGEVSRENMPIIQPQQMQAFASFVSEQTGSTVNLKQEQIPAASLKPYQTELFFPKTVWFALQYFNNLELATEDLVKRPFSLISSDNYIIDGNHRWGQIMLISPKSSIEGTRINLPVAKLLPLARKFSELVGNDRATDRGGSDLSQFTKIKGNSESFEETRAAERSAAEEQAESIASKAKLATSKKQLLSLFGPKMYKEPLGTVVVKETIQNSYDAIKDLKEINEDLKPEIEYGSWDLSRPQSMDNLQPWSWGDPVIREADDGRMGDEKDTFLAPPPEIIEDVLEQLKKGEDIKNSQYFFIRDNGIGMTPEIITSAFFTIGGTYKTNKRPSGGLGVAKMQMLNSADEIYLQTVRDGLESTVKVDNETLMAEEGEGENPFFDIVTRKTDAPSGTQIWFKFPQEIYDKKVDLTEKFAVGNLFDESISIEMNHFKPPFMFGGGDKSTFQTQKMDDLVNYDFALHRLSTPQANVDVYVHKIGRYDKAGKKISKALLPWGHRLDNGYSTIYSNGLYQFEDRLVKENPNEILGDSIPFHFIINVRPKTPAADINYPFNNTREGWSPNWGGKGDKSFYGELHPIDEEVTRLQMKYRDDYNQQRFVQEFDINKGIDGKPPTPMVPVIYNNMDFDLSEQEQNFMTDFSKVVFYVADQYLALCKEANAEGLYPMNHSDLENSVLNSEKTLENSKDPDVVSYHYGSALSKNWGGVQTNIAPRMILVNPVYHDPMFNNDGSLSGYITTKGAAAVLEDIIRHEVNHVSNKKEGANFTYGFSIQKLKYEAVEKIKENAINVIENIIINNYETFKGLRQKFVKGSTKFLNAEIQGNKFVRTFDDFNDASSGKIRSEREIVEQNFGEGVRPQDIQVTDGNISLIEAVSRRTFRHDVDFDPPSSDNVQDTRIGVQPTTDWTLYAGKQVGGLYISSEAIENGYSVLSKPANQEKKKRFEEAKVRLETYLEEERIQAELNGEVYVPFSYDVVSIEKDQVRFVLMSDLTEAHPHVVESLRVPIDTEQPVQEGRTGNAIYHRMEQVLGFKHPLYQYHKTITDLEEALGLLNLKDDSGKKVFPSGSERVWKQQVESTGYRYDSLKEEHRKIKEKFFGDPQDTLIGQEDITQTPEYIESSEAWDTLIDILRADIKITEEDPDDIAGPIPNPVKFLQRKVYGKDAEMGWRKGGKLWSLFYGPYERTLRKYLNKSDFFRKAIQDVVLSYKSTTDRLLKETYTKNGLDIPSRTIFEATGTTQFAPSEEVAQSIQDNYLNRVDEINKDSSLEGDEKKEALLEAYNAREAAKQQASQDVLKSARKRKSEALEIIRKDSPELAKHIISLRKLADSVSSEIGNMISLAAPNLQLRIDERLDIYLTTQYRAFTRPNWTEEFLELEMHRTARDLSLNYFADEYVKTQTEYLVREGGLDKETAIKQAQQNLEDKPELKMMALENFLKSYDKDFGVDSLKKKGNLPAALRGALGEFSEETNMDVLYRTLLNLGTLVSKMSLKDKLVSQGIKSGWLVTQEKAALERKRAEEAGRPDPYEDYVEVVKSKDSSISEQLAGSLDDTGVKITGENFEVKLNPDGTVKEAPRSKPPSSDPLINYRVKTEDGSVEKKGNLLARPDVKQAILQVLNPKQGMTTPDNEYVQIALKLFGGIEKSVAGLTGLGMLSKTLGSIPFYERQILGSFLFLSQNGIPISGYVPELKNEIGRSVLPSGVFKKRSYLEGRSADRGDMVYYASLKSMGVLDEGIVYSVLKDLLSGNISKEDVELEIDHLKHPTESILKKSKLFPEGSTSEKALQKAAALLKGAGKVKDIPIGKAQALALALDNAIKVQAYEYERSWLLDAREDSQSAERNDEYRNLSSAELDEMAAQIVLRTQQSRSQSAPIVEFFNLPVIRIVTAPFARFLAENPRLLVNIMRQSSAEMNSSNPVIKERGSQRNKGFLFTNFVLYMALPMFLQRFVAGLSDDEERVLRKSAPEFSRFQNLFYLKNPEGEIGTVSLSYVHPMSPILDFAMRGFEHTMRGDIKEAVKTVTIGYLTDTFLNDQIFWSAIQDVKNNTDRNTGQPIVGEYTPDALKIQLSYIFEKGLAPPTLLAASKAVEAIGTDYPKGEEARTFLGQPIYSPQGQVLRHLMPVKFYPLQLESMARRRFREIYDNLYIDAKNKNKLRRLSEGFDPEKIDKLLRSEFKSLSSGLKDARLAYNVYNDLLMDEGLVQEIMKGSRFKGSLIDVVARGYLSGEDLLAEGESVIDKLQEQGASERASQLYEAYLNIIKENQFIELD
tara:strand:- start:6737 stop:25636 length:18900 start_codon:yes stop_codon:yes gene_type:complete